MTTTASPAALGVTGPVFSEPGQLALAGFLASYTGLTREAYARLRPVRSLVRRAVHHAVRRTPCRHRMLRPRSGN